MKTEIPQSETVARLVLDDDVTTTIGRLVRCPTCDAEILCQDGALDRMKGITELEYFEHWVLTHGPDARRYARAYPVEIVLEATDPTEFPTPSELFLGLTEGLPREWMDEEAGGYALTQFREIL